MPLSFPPSPPLVILCQPNSHLLPLSCAAPQLRILRSRCCSRYEIKGRRYPAILDGDVRGGEMLRERFLRFMFHVNDSREPTHRALLFLFLSFSKYRSRIAGTCSIYYIVEYLLDVIISLFPSRFLSPFRSFSSKTFAYSREIIVLVA